MKRILYTQFFLLTVLATAAQCSVDSTKLLYLKFSGNLADSSVYHHPVTDINNPVAISDHTGAGSNAMQFGFGSHLVVADSNTNYKCQFPITVALWVKPDTIGVFTQIFTNEDNQQAYTGVWLQTTDSNLVAFSFGNGVSVGGDFRNTAIGHTKLPLHQWTHVVAVVRGVNDFSLYLNGEPEGFDLSGDAQTLVYTNSISDPARVALAYKGNGTAGRFYGGLDEISFWNDSLTAADAKYLYTQSPVYAQLFNPDTIRNCSSSNFNVTVNTPCGVLWSTGATTPSVSVPVTGSETLTAWVTNQHGTVMYDSVWLWQTTITDAVSVSANVLTAAQADAFYQWVDCGTNTAINGVNTKVYTAPANGSYAVIISTVEGCTDTSECVNVTGVGVDDFRQTGIHVYPNPFTDRLLVGAVDLADGVTVELYDATGRIVACGKTIGSEVALDCKMLQAGVYVLQVTNAGQKRITRVVKQ